MLPTNRFPHVCFAVLTVSDTRSEETDRSGKTIKSILLENDHRITDYKIVKDERKEIVEALEAWCNNPAVQAIILTGGTGFTPRDVTYEAVTSILEKEMTGFGELF